MIVWFLLHTARWFLLPVSVAAGTGRVLVGAADGRVHAHRPTDQPGRVRRACTKARIRAQTPSRCHRRNHRYNVCHSGYTVGTSRHGEPVLTRHRIPSMITLMVHLRPITARSRRQQRLQRSPPQVGQVVSPRCRDARHEVSGVTFWLGRLNRLPVTSSIFDHRHAAASTPHETWPRHVS